MGQELETQARFPSVSFWPPPICCSTCPRRTTCADAARLPRRVQSSHCLLLHIDTQVYTVPVYDMIEHRFLRSGIKLGFPGRFMYRTTYVILNTFIAITLVCFSTLFCIFV